MTTFQRFRDIRPYVLREGITARAVNGERLTMAVIDLEPDVVLPEHHHENEQLGFVISGLITMRIGGERREVRAGETYSIPSDVPHDALAGPEGCTVVDVFAPVRADWEKLPRLDATPSPRWP
ncbi:MAG TPA: cupin domain-containing protein [Candidatus Dormibacteraeota bacterium]